MNEPQKGHPPMDHVLIDRIKKRNDGDALTQLMNRYQPLVKSMAAKYYVRDMDFEDWEQEAALILIKICRNYDRALRINFGAYYRRCLRNRFYDFIRRQSAKKRIPNNSLMSYSVNRAYYDDLMADMKATHPERSILVTEDLKNLIGRCSSFERRVILDFIVKHRSVSLIAKRNHCLESKVKNASERYRRKYHKMRKNGAD